MGMLFDLIKNLHYDYGYALWYALTMLLVIVGVFGTIYFSTN